VVFLIEDKKKQKEESMVGLRVCMSLCAVLLLCELGSLSAASEKLSAREAAMAGSHHDAMPGGVPAAAGDESLQAEEEAEEASTDSEGSEGGEEGNDGEDNEGAREQGDVDAEIPAENLGDDDVDDANGGGLPPMEEEHAYFALLDTSQGERLPASVCCCCDRLCVSADYAAAAAPSAILF
jgi:hypothetical protein